MAGTLGGALKGLGAPNFNNRAWLFGLIEAVHARSSTTLSANASLGAFAIETAASVAANSLVAVTITNPHGSGTVPSGPLQIQSVSGSGPYILVLSGPLLTSALVNGTAYTSLAVTAVPVPIPAGSSIVLTWAGVGGGAMQTFVTSAATVAGATSIPVVSQQANANYPAMTAGSATGTVVTVSGNATNNPQAPAVSAFPVGRSLPNSAASGAKVMVIPTIDVYLNGAQHIAGPNNTPAGTTGQKSTAKGFLTTGVRYLYGYTPAVGHVAVIARGSGLSRSMLFAVGRLA